SGTQVAVAALGVRKATQKRRRFMQRAQQRRDVRVGLRQEIDVRAIVAHDVAADRDVSDVASACLRECRSAPGWSVASRPRPAQPQAELQQLALELLSTQEVISEEPPAHHAFAPERMHSETEISRRQSTKRLAARIRRRKSPGEERAPRHETFRAPGSRRSPREGADHGTKLASYPGSAEGRRWWRTACGHWPSLWPRRSRSSAACSRRRTGSASGIANARPATRSNRASCPCTAPGFGFTRSSTSSRSCS